MAHSVLPPRVPGRVGLCRAAEVFDLANLELLALNGNRLTSLPPARSPSCLAPPAGVARHLMSVACPPPPGRRGALRPPSGGSPGCAASSLPALRRGGPSRLPSRVSHMHPCRMQARLTPPTCDGSESDFWVGFKPQSYLEGVVVNGGRYPGVIRRGMPHPFG